MEELSSLNKLHDEIDSVSLLEYVVHTYEEGVVHLLQD